MKKRRRITTKMLISAVDGQEEALVTDSLGVQCDASISPLITNSILQSPHQRKVLSSLTYNRNLLKYLNDDRQSQRSFCDLVIVVEGQEFQVHKVVVAVGSSYFHACLTKNPNTEVVTLDHVSSSVFQHLLNFLYTSEFLVLDTEIRLVLEAAKFLDIIDAVKLLATESDCLSPAENQPSSTVAEESVNKLENSHKCPLCERIFCYKKTLDNHMDKAHKSNQIDVPNDSDLSTRKSTRKRKCPLKYEDQEDLASDSEASNSESYKSSQDRSDSEESDSEIQEEANGAEDNEHSLEGEDREEASGVDEGQSSGEQEDSEGKNENSISSQNFPDGLAPIELQNNGKKVLKCPKCEKVFDRLGKYESHTRVHTGEKPFECDICNLRYSTKSNLTVHRKRHNNEKDIPRKEHKCPFCIKLHASRKTLVKHVKRELKRSNLGCLP